MIDPTKPADIVSYFEAHEERLARLERAQGKQRTTTPAWPVELFDPAYVTLAGTGVLQVPWSTEFVTVYPNNPNAMIYVSMLLTPASSTTALTFNVVRSLSATGAFFTDLTIGTVSVPGNSGSKLVSGMCPLPFSEQVGQGGQCKVRFELVPPNTAVSWKAYKPTVRAPLVEEGMLTAGLNVA